MNHLCFSNYYWHVTLKGCDQEISLLIQFIILRKVDSIQAHRNCSHENREINFHCPFKKKLTFFYLRLGYSVWRILGNYIAWVKALSLVFLPLASIKVKPNVTLAYFFSPFNSLTLIQSLILNFLPIFLRFSFSNLMQIQKLTLWLNLLAFHFYGNFQVWDFLSIL